MTLNLGDHYISEYADDTDIENYLSISEIQAEVESSESSPQATVVDWTDLEDRDVKFVDISMLSVGELTNRLQFLKLQSVELPHPSPGRAIWQYLNREFDLVFLGGHGFRATNVAEQGSRPSLEANKIVSDDFRPSLRLIELWTKGIRKYISSRESDSLPSNTSFNLDERELTNYGNLQREFSVKLKRMFSQLGYRMQRSLIKKAPISDEGRFSLPVQLALLDRFPLEPHDAGDFFSLLLAELSDYLTGGGAISGNWGRLVLIDGRIEMALLPEPSAGEAYEAATMIE